MFEIGFKHWHGHVVSFAFDIRHGQFYLEFEIEKTKINTEMTTILNLNPELRSLKIIVNIYKQENSLKYYMDCKIPQIEWSDGFDK